jgi:superfamily II helicase
MKMECAKCLTYGMVVEFDGEFICTRCMEEMIEDDS